MSVDRPTLLFLTTELPFPPQSGGRLKSYKLLEQLASRYEVRLLCAYGGERENDARDLKARLGLTSIQVFQNHIPRTPFHFINAILSAPSFNAYRIYSKEIETMVKWSSQAADLVVIDHLEVVDLLPEKLNTPLVYHSHNAEYVLWEDFSALKGTFFTKWLFEWEAQRVKMLERYALRKATISFVAPNDRTRLEGLNGVDPQRFRETLHLGNDDLLDLPEIDLEKNRANVFYAGTLSWEPNCDGLKWFLTECWPAVLTSLPEARFEVCGGGAEGQLLHLLKHTQGVIYHGFVEDLDSVMRNARCAIVPLRIGSGMKIKSFDAMYRGLPLVTTQTGAEGISLQNKVDAIVVDDPSAFSEAVISTLNDTATATTMRENARRLCLERYRYKPLLEQMEREIASIR